MGEKKTTMQYCSPTHHNHVICHELQEFMDHYYYLTNPAHVILSTDHIQKGENFRGYRISSSNV